MNVMVVMNVMDIMDVVDTEDVMYVQPVPCWEAGTEETSEELSSHIGVSPCLHLLLQPTVPGQ